MFLFLIFFGVTLDTMDNIAMMKPSDLNEELSPDFKKQMPAKLIDSARLAANRNFKGASELIIQYFKENGTTLNPIAIKQDLDDNFKKWEKHFTECRNSYDQTFSVENYIFEYFAGYLWWHCYIPVLEKITEKD
jgi:hypothetical protein